MKTNKRRMLAEWEAQSMVQLTWPHRDTDWAPILQDITAVYRNMAREIAKREALLIVAPASLSAELGKMENASITSFTSNDTWARDHGFITVEEDQQLVLLDFQFNGWGEKFEAERDNAINRHLYDQGLVKGAYEQHLDFVLEGGSIESDGQGTVFTTSCCLMAPHRNQPLTQQEIEERLKAWLGAERVVWLNHGSLIGDDTDGHIDTLVRICPNDTIVYTGGDDAHPDLRLMEEELRGLRTMGGKPYRLLRLPLPRPVFDEEHNRLPATYANYLVINGAVLVPTYNQPDLDAEAMSIISQAYPDREVVGIDCMAVVWQHGSLHCCTMQYY
ncbi:agmatine deiminase family protein [Xylanibacter brevis]|uniref:agmatine deiminase family protein n=1 Tax=Xylanibacter brevis TaxID=83231 RepID=UPI000484B92D|nr:agmatine deiminase family protein [Xylanibacter brevis]